MWRKLVAPSPADRRMALEAGWRLLAARRALSLLPRSAIAAWRA